MSTRGIAPAQLAPSDLLEQAARALANAPAGPLILSLPAPDVDPLRLLTPDDDAFFWTDRDGRSMVGCGSAFALGAEGDDRFRTVRDRATALLRGIRVLAADGIEPPAPRFMGGGAFATMRSDGSTDASDDGAWHHFADLWFTVPRLAWFDDVRLGARLQIAITEGEDAVIRRRTLDMLERLLGEVAAAPMSASVRGDLAAPAERARWRTLASAILAAIDDGVATKIVAARRTRLRIEAPLDPATLAHAMRAAGDTYRYLVRIGEITFAGATPERLIERRGDALRTEAVAGTAAADDDGTPLREREKDRREHQAVVVAIDAALRPLAASLEHAAEPIVRQHGSVAHLVTPFKGRGRPDTHVLDLTDALHPTPAVAGTPRGVALDFITRHEGMRRGWYAGPIGWFDANGEGELAVALRCVRIEGSAVDVFAGAGLVAGSDPDAEFDETVLKMHSTLASLGLELVA